jgi:hypothetical protein
MARKALGGAGARVAPPPHLLKFIPSLRSSNKSIIFTIFETIACAKIEISFF